MLLMLLSGMRASLCAQVVGPADTTSATMYERAQRWMEAGSFHVARIELEKLVRRELSHETKRDVLVLLTKADFADREFEEAYQRSSEVLLANPSDPELTELQFMNGVSAFHSGRSTSAIQSLTAYIDHQPPNPKFGEALYWRAMSRLDLGDQAGTQSDLERAYNSPAAGTERDYALMGFALSLERQKEYTKSAERLEQVLSEYPNSKLRTDAQIRLASVSLRLNRPRRAVDVLNETKPRYSAQREEYLLLRAEAEFRLSLFDRAQESYRKFVDEFQNSPNARKARFGLAWSKLKRGDSAGARAEFDSLATGKDSLAFAAMYESGVLSLLEGNTNTALSRFDSLVEHTPYDSYADKAYYQMGLIKYRAQLFREARHNFQLAARLYPDSPLRVDAFHMMGQACMSLRDFSNAQYAFAQVRKLNGSGIVLANAMFQEGVALYHLGRFRTCGERFNEFLQKFPKDQRVPEALVWKGETLYQDGKFDDAEQAYADALKVLPDSPKREDATYGYAWTLFEQKKFSQAATAFDRFTTSYANSGRALEASLRKADCYFFIGQYEKSSALYEALASAKTDDKNIEYAAFQLAMSYIERGESDRGIGYLRSFLTAHPSSIYAEVVQFNIGWTYFSKERYPEAIAEFHLLEKKFPESQLMPRVLFNTGDAFFNTKSYDSALVYYQRVIKEYPSSPIVSDALAGVQYTYQAQGKPQRALEEIDTVLAKKLEGISPEELYARKGDILFEQGNFYGAIKEYGRLLSMNPSPSVKAKTRFQLGRAYELQNESALAIQFYQGILKEFPESDVAPTAALALGMTQIKTKQYKGAVTNLRFLCEHYPESPLVTEARYQLGIALLNIPDLEQAFVEFRSVISSSPDNIFSDRSRLQIARLHQERHEYAISFDTLNNLLTRHNDEIAIEALLMIGENYALQKKYREALQSYNDIIQQYAEFPLQIEKARYGLGLTYEKMKDRKQAKIQYQAIVKSPVDPAMKKEAEQRLKKLK